MEKKLSRTSLDEKYTCDLPASNPYGDIIMAWILSINRIEIISSSVTINMISHQHLVTFEITYCSSFIIRSVGFAYNMHGNGTICVSFNSQPVVKET